jgi:hypothetical protein
VKTNPYSITVKHDGSWSQLGYDHGPKRDVKVIRQFTTAKGSFAILRWGGGKEGGLGGTTYPIYYRLVRIVKEGGATENGITYQVETVFEMQPGRYSHKALTELDRYAKELV